MPSNPIRVAQVMGVMNGGGVESVVMNYYRHIDRERIQFDFIVNSNSEMVPQAEIETLGGRVYYVPPYSKLPSYMREVKGILTRGGYKIVHSHVNALSVFPLAAAKAAGVPNRIAHSHSTSGRGECLKNALKSLLKRFSRVYPTKLIACSNYAGDWLFGRNAPYEVLYNAVDLEKFAFNSETRQRIRNELRVDGNTFVVGHVGRFMTQKNHAYLIEVFREVLQIKPNSVLVLVGTGELSGEIKQKVVNLGIEDKVLFLGQRQDVADLYQAFDVFVLPSLYEGLCLVGVEAQRNGLPCFFSSEVTSEEKLTDGARFLSLDQSPKDWAQQIVLSSREEYLRTDNFAKYEIREAAKHLEKKYLDMAN